MKYTFSDEELDVDSDGLSVRRSTRNSGRENSAAPAGPTVTASGRQVRSRAAGMYGESLLSGQTTEGASPATGDYVRSDGSEEPQQPTHGRSTRASNTQVNGWPKGRKHIETYNSLDEMDDEDDATSWDGGDEDEDEPEQMDLDDEDDSRDNSSDEDEGPRSLVVRLKISNSAFASRVPPPTLKDEHLTKPEGAEQRGDVAIDPPLAGMPDARQTTPAPAPAPAPVPATSQTIEPPARPPSQLNSNIVANGIPSHQQQTTLPAIIPVAQQVKQTGDPHTLPKLESLFHAPTPPYTTQEEPNPPAPAHFPVSKPEPPHSPKSFASTLPPPTSASSWQ